MLYILFDKEMGIDLLWSEDIEKLKNELNSNRIIFSVDDSFNYDVSKKRCKVILIDDEYYIECKDKNTQEVIEKIKLNILK
jgi:uncharacterized FlaG/YvyC family protein